MDTGAIFAISFSILFLLFLLGTLFYILRGWVHDLSAFCKIPYSEKKTRIINISRKMFTTSAIIISISIIIWILFSVTSGVGIILASGNPLVMIIFLLCIIIIFK